MTLHIQISVQELMRKCNTYPWEFSNDKWNFLNDSESKSATSFLPVTKQFVEEWEWFKLEFQTGCV